MLGDLFGTGGRGEPWGLSWEWEGCGGFWMRWGLEGSMGLGPESDTSLGRSSDSLGLCSWFSPWLRSWNPGCLSTDGFALGLRDWVSL